MNNIDYKKLEKNYNIVDNNNDIYTPYLSVEKNIKKMKLCEKIIIISNIITIFFFSISMLFVINKPVPTYFASTTSGKIYHLNSKEVRG